MTQKFGIPRDEADGREIIEALVAALYALRELTEASESVHVYPEGSVGLDDLSVAEQKARKVLDRFDFEEPGDLEAESW